MGLACDLADEIFPLSHMKTLGDHEKCCSFCVYMCVLCVVYDRCVCVWMDALVSLYFL